MPKHIGHSLSPAKSDVMRTLAERGFLHQCTDLIKLDDQLRQGPIVVYSGFDLTANSLHVGHLVPIMMLRWFQHFGHKPIVLLGGATSRIGDPSLRNIMRPMLDEDEIALNVDGIRVVFEKLLTFGMKQNDALLVSNTDWLDDLCYVDFLRHVARHFSVNRMLSSETVRSRLRREQSLSLLEFSYAVIQAYDFVHLARHHGCVLQLGGSDQWGNIVAGVELGRRIDSRNLFGITAPLLTTASGAKMGKSNAGAVWLNSDRLSSYDFWQFWRNTSDADVGRFLRLFTKLSIDEIERLEGLRGEEVNDAKKILADAVTGLCHGEAASTSARETAHAAFERASAPSGLPTVRVELVGTGVGMSIVDLLLVAKLVASKSEAKRLILGRGARVNDELVLDPTMQLFESDVQETDIKLSAGRKRHAIVRVIGRQAM
ncbi:MAG: tyrosine--tRNA ligase [Pseudomonadota bacterium]